MNKILDKRKINILVLLFSATYMISYITRINYGAIISEMQTATGFSKSLLSMSLTGSFITYGLGQIVSGIFGDKISSKKLVTIGLCITVVMNLLIPVCQNPYQMLAVWSANGFAQSFMWPPIVKILTSVLTDADYKHAISKVSWGSSIGTMIVYLVSPLLISVFGWKSVFVVSAVLAFAMIFVWNKCACDATPQVKEKETSTTKLGVLFAPIMVCIMLAIVMQGILRDGITTWMPSYISETYNLSNEISILSGIVLPIFSILCFQAATKLHTKKIKNPLACAGLFFGVGAASGVGLYFLTGASAFASVLMFAIFTGCMYGVNLLLVCIIPSYFKNTGKVSTVSGVLNSCTYVGSALSTYGVAVLSEKSGWNFTVLVWLFIAIAGTIICAACAKNWKKYIKTL